MKKLTSVLLLMIVLIPMAIPAAAEGISGSCGEALTWEFDTSTGVITISGSGDMEDYSSDDTYATTAPWQQYISSIKSVVIEDGVTSIGNYAFCKAKALKIVTLPDSVTSIGDYSFATCTSLGSLNMPDSLTDIGTYAFYGSYCLPITIPATVKSIGDYAFEGLDTDPYTVTYEGTEEQWAEMSVINNSGVVIYFVNYDVKIGVCGIGTNKQNVKWRLDLNTGTLTVSGSGGVSFFDKYWGNTPWWYNRFDITTVIVEEGITSIGSCAFMFFDELYTIYLPSSVTTIYRDAFIDCFARDVYYGGTEEQWSSITIENGNSILEWADITYVKMATSGSCGDNVSWALDLSSGALTITGSGDMYDYTSKTDTPWEPLFVKSVNIEEGITSIGSSAFEGCKSLGILSLPASIERMGENAFFNSGNNLDVNITDITRWLQIDFENEEANPLQTEYVQLRLNGSTVKSLNVPEGITEIKDYAFTGYSKLSSVRLSRSVTRIGDRAFKDCNNLSSVHIEYATVDIDDRAFQASTTVNILCYPNSIAHSYAVSNSIPYSFITGDTSYPAISVDGYDISITKADDILDIGYVLGRYITADEVVDAEGFVALSESVVDAGTEKGIFNYNMPVGGRYTVLINMNDGTSYILHLDVTDLTTTVTSSGVTITLHDLYEIKDFFIAKGKYKSYEEIKKNGYIFSAGAAKTKVKRDYTYTVYEPGIHTILIRYNDGTQALFHETLTVDEPTFTTNGLQITIGNIPDVKVIRTAYGEWNTVKELKATDTIRNFSNKSVIKNAEEYTIQYRDEGTVTVIVEYNNGYVKVYHYDVQQKEPTVEQNGNNITFGNLEGLNVIRYAKGEYTTSKQIKNAQDSKYFKPADIIDGTIVVTLESGTYTFCVQYDDESYNYYTIVVE